jgi:hypothetical protein
MAPTPFFLLFGYFRGLLSLVLYDPGVRSGGFSGGSEIWVGTSPNSGVAGLRRLGAGCPRE